MTVASAPWRLAMSGRRNGGFPGSGTWRTAGRPRQHHCRQERQHPGRDRSASRSTVLGGREIRRTTPRSRHCQRTDDPDELYRNSYEFILSGDYSTAEAGFRDHISRFPTDPKAVRCALLAGRVAARPAEIPRRGGSLPCGQPRLSGLGQGAGHAAEARHFAERPHQHDVACATYKEIGKRYPKSSDALKQRVKQEQALAAC